MKRREPPNKNTSRVRGLCSNQWQGLRSWLQNRRSLVCRAEEEVPMLDFLDLIYEPEAKTHWLANHYYFGSRWVTGHPANLANTLVATVRPRAASKNYTLRIFTGGNSGSTQWCPYTPEIGGDRLCRSLEFTPLDMLSGSGLPERIRPLHEKYGRHIVRCARENEVFNMAMRSVAYLFENAVCTRMIAHFFPEIIPYVPHGKLTYWAKTKTNSFAGKYKEDKYALDNMAVGLGQNWEIYKKFIMSLVARALIVEAIDRERGTDPVDGWAERGWYETPENGGKPIEDWRVRLVFSP